MTRLLMQAGLRTKEHSFESGAQTKRRGEA
jgi:hypothetical protein